MAAGNHLFRFQEGTPPVDMGRLPSQSAATCLLVDRSGALWIGTVSDGLFRWQADAVERVPTSQQEITCLFEDLEGNILAGTAGGGLNIIRPRVAALSGAESGLPFESVLSVSEDSEGGIWAVAQDGSLGCGREGGWDLLSDGTGWPGGKATCVATDPKGGVWVGTRVRVVVGVGVRLGEGVGVAVSWGVKVGMVVLVGSMVEEVLQETRPTTPQNATNRTARRG